MVTFRLAPDPYGLIVERIQCSPVGACLVQILLFADSAEFNRWCDSDLVRFNDPLIYDQLRREGNDYLDGR
jgi:hypothetical protein